MTHTTRCVALRASLSTVLPPARGSQFVSPSLAQLVAANLALSGLNIRCSQALWVSIFGLQAVVVAFFEGSQDPQDFSKCLYLPMAGGARRFIFGEQVTNVGVFVPTLFTALDGYSAWIEDLGPWNDCDCGSRIARP